MMCSDFDLIHVAVRKETETNAIYTVWHVLKLCPALAQVYSNSEVIVSCALQRASNCQVPDTRAVRDNRSGAGDRQSHIPFQS